MCCTCGRPGVLHDNGCYYLDPSHVKSRGSGGGDENNIVPQCRECHTRYGIMGRRRYEETHEVNMQDLANYYGKLYREAHGIPDAE